MTLGLEGRCSIQLSYGRINYSDSISFGAVNIITPRRSKMSSSMAIFSFTPSWSLENSKSLIKDSNALYCASTSAESLKTLSWLFKDSIVRTISISLFYNLLKLTHQSFSPSIFCFLGCLIVFTIILIFWNITCMTYNFSIWR